MNPKKFRNLLPDIAVENKEDLTLLQALTEFYWDKVRDTLSNSSDMNVNVTGLGVFFRKPWVVKEEIEKTEKILKNLRPQAKEKQRESLRKRLEELRAIEASYLAQEELKKKTKTRKDEYFKALGRER